MEQRNKYWRRRHTARLFKQRMIFWAACGRPIINEDGSCNEHPHWFELAKERGCKVYKSTGTPCSCWLCKSESYNRTGYKRETARIIEETWE